MNKKLSNVFKKASEIAAVVPETMQAAAFNRALDLLLKDKEIIKPDRSKSESKGIIKNKKILDENNINPVQAFDSIDSTKYPIINSDLSVLNRSLYILKIGKDELDIDGLIPPQIAKILTDKFRVKTGRKSISSRLGEAGSLVDRRKEGRGYIYRIMASGDEYLTQQNNEPIKPKVKKPKQNIKRVGSKEKINKPKRKSSGRPGQKKILEKLISDGVFSKPKLISDITSHLEITSGYSFTQAELSPALLRLIRDGKLKREKGENNLYEYSIK